jgi:predicted adenylyl cyclase CyaB
MKAIEVEVRSFISKEKYEELLNFFKQNSKILVKDDYQESYYFNCKEDLRIQKNKFYSKIWLKKGKIHDDFREEIEIKVDNKDFAKLEDLFKAIGYDVEIKWFRTRWQFLWEEINVSLDYTKGYGYIIEFEKIVKYNPDEEYLDLKEKLENLGVQISSKDEFNKKFNGYKENWKELIKF